MKGRLIVFEGADGSGKTTQAKLLFNFLKKKKVPAVLTSFPRYQSAWGRMVRRYLDGEFGDVNDVNPYLASALYAGDRLLAKVQLSRWLGLGKVIVCDRYMASNIAHQAAKIQNTKYKIQFIKWLEDLEYKENKIPKEDLVILLTIPVLIAQKFMSVRKRDIHESDINYQKKVAQAFEDLVKERRNWVKISNIKSRKLRSLQNIHVEILGILKQKELIQ